MSKENTIKRYLEQDKRPSISVGVIDEEGQEFFSRGEIEKKSGIKPDENTVYEIASVSKTFTSSLMSILQNNGLLDIHDSITKYIPELEKNSDFTKVTLEQISNHTSGLPNLPIKVVTPIVFSYYIPIQTDFYRRLREFDKPTMYDFLIKSKLKEPGKFWRYSNVATGLLGHAMEKITGLSYDELVRKYICEPLGMTNTGIHVDKSVIGYSALGVKTQEWHSPAIEAAASLRSTASDLTKFLGANLGVIPSNFFTSLEYAQNTRIIPKRPSWVNFLLNVWGIKADEIGLGWWILKLENKDILFHDGGSAGFTSCIAISPKDKTGIVALSNKAYDLQTHRLCITVLKELK